MNKKLHFAIVMSIFLFQAAIHAQIPEREKQALIDLYKSTDGARWAQKWDLNTSVTHWYGVEIEQGHVRGIVLYDNNLKGAIPATIKNLEYLEVLDLALNELNELPQEIGKLSRLRVLKLEESGLRGELPSNFTAMVNLEELVLSHNRFEGNIPESIGALKNLKILELSYNRLEGKIGFNFSDLENLSELGLSFNNFEGPVPHGIDDLVQLRSVQLQGNKFDSFDSIADMKSSGFVVFDTDNIQMNMKYKDLDQIDSRMVDIRFEDIDN